MNKFEQLGLSESLLKAILDLGFENPTEVQEKAIPYYWKRHRYGCVGSDRDRENGSFGFPVIQKIDANNRNTQALILSPTRELCLQITNEIKTTQNTKRY
jgi:ATP-dependent RNA helicase DeaD